MATPLGNPGDLSPRARDILGKADGILAEDTRRTGLLFARLGIKAASFTSLHEHNELARLPQVLSWLQEGNNLALVSDAGTPLLSDPGYRLVRACRDAGITVSPLPGACAPVVALSAAGLPPSPFVFLGFLPRKESERRLALAPYTTIVATLTFFERKDRLKAALKSAFEVLGSREGCIARELTKIHEEFIPFSLERFDELPDGLLGEITVLLGPPMQRQRTQELEVNKIMEEEARTGGKIRDVLRRVQARITGWDGKELYQRVKQLREKA